MRVVRNWTGGRRFFPWLPWLACVALGAGCARAPHPPPAAPPPHASARSVAAPQVLGSATDWTAIVAEFRHSCGLRADGSLWCWGSHFGTTPGSGSFVANARPRRYALYPAGPPARWLVADEPLRFDDFGVGDRHLCGLRADGAVFCWGHDEASKLGLGAGSGAARR